MSGHVPGLAPREVFEILLSGPHQARDLRLSLPGQNPDRLGLWCSFREGLRLRKTLESLPYLRLADQPSRRRAHGRNLLQDILGRAPGGHGGAGRLPPRFPWWNRGGRIGRDRGPRDPTRGCGPRLGSGCPQPGDLTRSSRRRERSGSSPGRNRRALNGAENGSPYAGGGPNQPVRGSILDEFDTGPRNLIRAAADVANDGPGREIPSHFLHRDLIALGQIRPAGENSHAAPREIVGDGSLLFLRHAVRTNFTKEQVRGELEAFVPAGALAEGGRSRIRGRRQRRG